MLRRSDAPRSGPTGETFHELEQKDLRQGRELRVRPRVKYREARVRRREEGRCPCEEGRCPCEDGRCPCEEGRSPCEEGRCPCEEGRREKGGA